MPKGYKIRTKDAGARKFWRKVSKAQPVLRVGVLDSPGRTHPNSDTASVGEVAIWNEYGTQTVPARSFVGGWALENEKKFAETLATAARKYTLEKADREVELGKVGKRFANGMKKRIRNVIRPLNSIYTLERKKGDTPLIDTGTLIRSITFTVEQ
jgi:hypothetical protein